jgi:hypothetical protein
MLNADEARAWVDKHFDTVTDEEFVARVKRVSPDLAQEFWGDRSVEEICRERRSPMRRARGMFASFGRSVVRLFS